MRKKAILWVAALLCFVPTFCHAFYYNVDEEISLTPLTGGWVSAGNLFSMQFEATNTGTMNLTNLGFTTQFVWSGNLAMYYENSSHQWVTPAEWVKVYGVQNQNDLLLMDRSSTNIPLSWDQNGTVSLATLLETDAVPVLWLGNLNAGQTIQFTWYADCSSRLDLNVTGFFVSTVPEPLSLMGMGIGAGFILRRKKKV